MILQAAFVFVYLSLGDPINFLYPFASFNFKLDKKICKSLVRFSEYIKKGRLMNDKGLQLSVRQLALASGQSETVSPGGVLAVAALHSCGTVINDAGFSLWPPRSQISEIWPPGRPFGRSFWNLASNKNLAPIWPPEIN